MAVGQESQVVQALESCLAIAFRCQFEHQQGMGGSQQELRTLQSIRFRALTIEQPEAVRWPLGDTTLREECIQGNRDHRSVIPARSTGKPFQQ